MKQALSSIHTAHVDVRQN